MAHSAKQLQDALHAIRALREYIQAMPDNVVATLPAMPGIDADWMDAVEEGLKSAAATHRSHLGLVQLAQQVGSLNPGVGEIGPGKLAQLVEQAKAVLAVTED